MSREKTWQEEEESGRLYNHPSSQRARADREQLPGPRARLVTKQGRERRELEAKLEEKKRALDAKHRHEQNGDTVRRDAWTGKVIDHQLIAKQERQQRELAAEARRRREELRQRHQQEWNELRAQHTAPTRPAA